jgi:hypothetical protein
VKANDSKGLRVAWRMTTSQVRFADILSLRRHSKEEIPIGNIEVLSARPPGFGSCLLKRMAFDAGSEVGRFFPVVCIGSGLAGRCNLFECDSMFPDEGNEFVRGRSMDVIGVLGRLIVNFPRAEGPLHLHLIYGDGVGIPIGGGIRGAVSTLGCSAL